MSEAHRGYRDIHEYRHNLGRFSRPYVVLTVVAFGISILAAQDPSWVQFATGWALALTALFVAYIHPSFWLAAPFGGLAGILLIRSGTDGLEMGVGPLLLIPVLAIALYGSRRALVTVLAVVVCVVFAVHLATNDEELLVTSVWRQDLILVILACVLGVAIHELVSRLRDERVVSDKRGEQLELVSRITRKLATSLEPSRTLCEMAVDLTGAGGAAVYRRTPEGTALLAWEAGSPRELREIGETVANVAIDEFRREPSDDQVRIYSAGSPQVERYGSAWLGFDVGSIACAPARAENEVIGLLVLAWPTGHDPADSVMPMDMLAAEASIAIRKQEVTEQLEHLATTDPLTGIDNRRGWNRMISAAVGRSRRHSQPLCLAILDLDGFKLFNDTNGHQAGDALLRQTASTWQRLIRVDDHIARYGGDEFLVTLPHTSLERAMEVVDRLREAVPPETRCSAGVALWDGQEPVGQLLERADRALYLAKADGAGQVRSALAE